MLWDYKTYRVGGEIPELAEEIVLPPEAWGRDRWSVRNECRGDSEEDIDAESSARANSRVFGSMGDRDTDDLPTEVGEVVNDESPKAGLVNDVGPAVDGACADDLGPDDEDEADIVYPAVDAVEEVEAKLGAVWETHEEGNDGENCHDYRARELDVPRVDDEGSDGVQHDEGGTESQHDEGEEEQEGPEVCTGHVQDCFRESQKADNEGAESFTVLRPSPEIAHDTEDGECGKVLEEDVAPTD